MLLGHSQNGSPSNPLAELVGQYNSDSETEDGRPRAHALNDQVNDFLKVSDIAHCAFMYIFFILLNYCYE